jgi:hypothetical protein
LSHVRPNLGEFFDVVRNCDNLEVLGVEFCHNFVGSNLGLFGNKLDFGLGNFEVLLSESITDRSAVNLEHGDDYLLRDLLGEL